MMEIGLAPVLAVDTEVVVLGSFPGLASLTAKRYYAHPRNQFWPLMAALLNESLLQMDYAERLRCLLAHRIGLWDVIHRCRREGSLDVAIRQAEYHDVNALRIHAPSLRRCGFNGKTAGKAESRFIAAGWQTRVLPSSSPAHAALSFEAKLASWRWLLDPDYRNE